MSTEVAKDNATGTVAPDTPTTSAKKESPPLFSLDILRIIKTGQLQHGLRHNDHQRYRQYCTRRIRRIRKSLKFLHYGGKHKYAKKTIEPATVTDSRFLLLVLIKAERAWSYAMQLKDDTNNPRARFHVHSRLAKAAKWAHHLEVLCNARADPNTTTILESEAYSAWMGGNLLLEKEMWKDALAHFSKARTIYDTLGKIGDGFSQELCKQRLDDIEPSIRYCEYNLTKQGDNPSNTLVDMKLGAKGLGMDLLQSKLDAVIAETLKKQAESLREVTWFGKKIPIRSEKVRVAILGAQEASYELEKNDTFDGKMAVYDKLFATYNDAQNAIREEQNSNAKGKSMKAEIQDENLQLLKTYVSFLKLTKTVERNLLLVDSYEKRLNGDKDADTESNKKKAKPDNLVHVYESLINNMTEISDLRMEDPEQAKENAARILGFKAARCFYMALSYSYASQWNEALALFNRASEQMQVALDHYKTVKNVSSDIINRLQDIESKIRGHRAEAHAKGFLESIKGKTEPNAEQKENAPKRSLLQGINEFDSSAVEQKHLISFPPDFEAIQCKPVLFDLVEFSFPSLEARKRPSKGQATGFWGLFGYGGKK